MQTDERELGLELGRLIWFAVVDGFGVDDHVTWPSGVLLLLVPAAFVAAVMTSWRPARRAAGPFPRPCCEKSDGRA